jgi:RNA polymerase sigma-70 factor (ECF subfamily)
MPPPDSDVEADSHLLRRVAAGDAVAARALYQLYATRVYSTIRRLIGDDVLAHDLSQEAWVRVFRALPQFRGDSAFSLWLHRIAVNGALQARRRFARHRWTEESLDQTVACAPRQEEDAERSLASDRIETALAQLPEGMRAVIVLHDVEGYTHAEIGAALRVSAGTSKSQLFKARIRMRELLGSGMNPEIADEPSTT